MELKNIIIEKNEPDICYFNPHKVFLDHNFSKLIGQVKVFMDGDVLKGDFSLKDGDYENLYPSLCYQVDADKTRWVMSVGLCIGKNEDESILTIGEQLNASTVQT